MHRDNMKDDEIRILGKGKTSKPQPQRDDKKRVGRNILLVIIAALVLITAFCLIRMQMTPAQEPIPADSLSTETIGNEPVKTLRDSAYVIVRDTVVNDIPMRTLAPVGGHMELYIGKNPEKNSDVILAAHAADIRADIDAPAGAFVYNGELISKGYSKLGFCAIINGEVSIGRQRETPLFERAIEENGCFFRQYSLVSNGAMIDIAPKGKAVRRALCLKDKMLMIISSQTPESFHDFAQALADMGVDEAISLIGGDAAVTWRDKDNNLMHDGEKFVNSYTTENFILWKR